MSPKEFFDKVSRMRKAQVTRARRKLEEYVAWNRANNLFFDEAADEELARFRAKLARKVAGVEAAEERMRRKIWNLKNDKNDQNT